MIRLLGSGGEGKVYLVKHLVTEQLRAAKLLGKGVNGDAMHELYMMKHLNHPSLPKVIDLIEEEQELWLIMEYIQGSQLQPVYQKKKAAEQFYAVAEQLADVLLYLHTRDSPVWHLDIKPANILICPNGRVVLIDFGTAIVCQDRNGEQHYYGTKGFASPEQQTKNERTDGRSDIYGFGAVMYYCLFGTPPETNSIEKRKVSSASNAIGWKKSAQKLIFRCMKKAKEERFQDSLQLYRAVIRQKKAYQLRMRIRKSIWAVIFLMAVILFGVIQLRNEYDSKKVTEETVYERLLKKSEQLGLEQAGSCYKEAAKIKPADYRWIEHFVGRVFEDYLFEKTEETWWNQLIFETVTWDGKTAKEVLAEQPKAYGRLANQIGTLYWYYYQESGGKYAAYKWFNEAVTVGTKLDPQPQWYEFAKIHAKIGEYYGKIGKKGIDGTYEISAQQYWSDLKEIWNTEFLKEQAEQLKWQVAEEILACLLLRGNELSGSGIEKEEMRQMAEEIRSFMQQSSMQKEQQENGLQKCDEAEKAIDRIFAEKE